MKITRISVEFMVDENTAVEEFMARLLSTATPVTIEHTPLPVSTQVATTAEDRATDAAIHDRPHGEGTSRRRRTSAPANPTEAPSGGAAITDAAPANSTEGTSRRRRAAPPAASPDPMPINDAEMSKAASNACEVLVNMGEDGPGIVKLILEEMGAASAGDVPQDKRQQFLDECAKEIRLAKEEKETAP